MNIFQEMKERVTARQVAERYGLKVSRKAECLIRYYKCILIGIILDWMENDASYDLIEFCQESCELFSGSGEKALLKCIIPQDKC